MTKLQVGCDKSSVSDPVFFTNPDPGSRGEKRKINSISSFEYYYHEKNLIFSSD